MCIRQVISDILTECVWSLKCKHVKSKQKLRWSTSCLITEVVMITPSYVWYWRFVTYYAIMHWRVCLNTFGIIWWLTKFTCDITHDARKLWKILWLLNVIFLYHILVKNAGMHDSKESLGSNIWILQNSPS